MEQVNDPDWPFDVPPGEAVVTTSYVTGGHEPVCIVTHEADEESGIIWQFHSGNGDYRPEVLQLVRLDEILGLDPSLRALANLPLGHRAERAKQTDQWKVSVDAGG